MSNVVPVNPHTMTPEELSDWLNAHIADEPLLQLFRFQHLIDEHLRGVSSWFAQLWEGT